MAPIPNVGLMIIALLFYIVPVVLLILWMIKLLRNSNENLKIQREILQKLNQNNH